MQRSKTNLYDLKLNLNPHSCNTLFYTKKMVKKVITRIKILFKAPLGETGSSGNQFLFTGCLSIQFFDSLPLFQHSQLGCLWLPNIDLCDLRDAMPHHWSPSASHPTPYLGKQGISLGLAIILSMYLCPHT